jgi:hypothetical protein
MPGACLAACAETRPKRQEIATARIDRSRLAVSREIRASPTTRQNERRESEAVSRKRTIERYIDPEIESEGFDASPSIAIDRLIVEG